MLTIQQRYVENIQVTVYNTTHARTVQLWYKNSSNTNIHICHSSVRTEQLIVYGLGGFPCA